MVADRVRVNRRMRVIRVLCLAVAALSLGTSAGWAQQRPTTTSAVRDKAAPKSKQKRVTSGPAKSSTAPAQRDDKAADSELSFSGARRDPFKLPEITVSKGAPVLDSAGGVLPPGVRGLVISQIRLQGVVREQAANKMIAVVTNETRRAYFLSENESVYNGVVSKITPDAVYFAENVLDTHGRVTTHEVVKRLGSASGEGR